MNILGTYKITYLDYKEPIIQYKNLISHDDFLTIIKPKWEEITNFEEKNNKKEMKRVKNELLSEFGEHWFTDKSSIFEAINTGKIELLYSVHNVRIEKYEN